MGEGGRERKKSELEDVGGGEGIKVDVASSLIVSLTFE